MGWNEPPEHAIANVDHLSYLPYKCIHNSMASNMTQTVLGIGPTSARSGPKSHQFWVDYLPTQTLAIFKYTIH